MASLDAIFDILSKRRRRYALYYLEQQNRPVSVSELTEQIANWESDPDQFTIPEGKFEDVEMSLKHQHLPKAAEVEFIEYDREREALVLTGSPSDFEAILSIAELAEKAREN